MKHDIRVRRKPNGLSLILTVMALGVILPMVGLAIDASLLYAVKAKLQAAVDAASLAGARSLNRGMDISSQADSARATAQAFFNANFPAGHLGSSNRVITVTVAEGTYRTRTVRTDASVDAPAYFMRMLGFHSTRLRGGRHRQPPGRESGPRAGPLLFHERCDDRHAQRRSILRGQVRGRPGQRGTAGLRRFERARLSHPLPVRADIQLQERQPER